MSEADVLRSEYQRLREENRALTAELVRLVRLTEAMRATIEDTQQAIRDISRAMGGDGWARP